MTLLSNWQVEYLNLVYGLVFVILASVSFGTGKTTGRRLPWVWLGLFGVTHGLGIWTFSLTTYNSDSLLLAFAKTGFLAVSFICLAEFGRAGSVRIQGRGPGRWYLIPLFIMAVLAGALKPGVLQAALLYMLGLAGGLPAAGALFMASRSLETHTARQYKTGGAAMALYALFAGLLVLPPPSFMAELFSSETLFDTFFISLQLFRFFLIFWLTMAVWGCSQAQFREDNGDKYLAVRSKYALLAAAILIMVLCLGWYFTWHLEYNGLFITLFLAVLTNIFFLVTQRSIEETARLSASEENYRTIFETTSAATFIVEEDYTISLVNRESEKLSGYTKAELEGKKRWTDFTAGEDLKRIVGYHKQRLINPDSAPRNYEVRIIDRYGNFKNMLLTVDIIPGTKKSVVSAVDITELKKTEEALRVSEERFYKIFNASPSIMSITTYGEGRFIFANERFLKELGYSIEEIIGLTAEEIKIWAKPERAEIKKMLQDNGLINNLECTLRKKSGEIFTSLYSAEIVYFNGEQHVLSAASDISEHKRLEEEMARLERLSLIGEMAAGIGHEIRNPMTTVRGFLQLLGSKEDSAHYKEYYDLMIDELDRANTIITEFLSLAKNRTVSKEMLNLNSIVEVLFPLIQADAMRNDKFIQLEVEDIPDLLLDEKEIRQLVLNLVRNGLEAMLPGGRVTIKTFKEGDKVVLAVQDEGKGIEPDVLEKLGTPFYTTKDSGTGLGLAVCYSIAARHNASIRVETGFAGTTFYIIFTP